MFVLKIVFLVITFAIFTVSALLIRNDRNNNNPWATIAFCLSMALLVCVQW